MNTTKAFVELKRIYNWVLANLRFWADHLNVAIVINNYYNVYFISRDSIFR